MPEKNYILFVINIHLGIQTDSYDRDRIADEMKTCPNTILVHKPTPLYTRPSACCGEVVTVGSRVSPVPVLPPLQLYTSM